MKSIVIIGAKLALICAVSAACLGYVNSITEPVISEYKTKELNQALSGIANGGIVGDEISVEEAVVSSYYPVADDNDKIKSYVLRLTGSGYAGDLKLLAAFNKEGSIISSVLLENQETPGLGKEAEKPEYMEKFKGKGSLEPIPVRKGQLSQEDADAISGASITFIGISKALEEGSSFVKKLGGIQ